MGAHAPFILLRIVKVLTIAPAFCSYFIHKVFTICSLTNNSFYVILSIEREG